MEYEYIIINEADPQHTELIRELVGFLEAGCSIVSAVPVGYGVHYVLSDDPRLSMQRMPDITIKQEKEQ